MQLQKRRRRLGNTNGGQGQPNDETYSIKSAKTESKPKGTSKEININGKGT